MIEKFIGKIDDVQFGYGGYDDAMFGLSLYFRSDKGSWGVGDFKGTWAFPPSDTAEWTIESQTILWGEMVRFIVGICSDAQVKNVLDLKGKPVEVSFENGMLESWRILTEVI